MLSDKGYNEKLQAIARGAIARSTDNVAEVARLIGRDYEGLRQWIKGDRDNEISSVSYLKMLGACGYDFIAWLDRRRPASPELRDYLEAPLMLDHIARGLIDPDEIEALRALDQIGFFTGKKPRQIEDWHVKIRREAKRKPSDVPK